ncbi:MAG: heme ABC transporter ATP-binding protein [Deltaproteobacteria bacterium]
MKLEAQEISVLYGARRAIDGVSCALLPGELLGIIGPNGSGKSTLVRALAGVLQPDTGTVLLDGRPLADLGRRERARRIALVPQETRLSFPLSVRELVLLGRTPHTGRFGWEGAADFAIAERAMQRMDLAGLAGRPVAELSGGERQRVVLARAFAQEPRVLLLDEPTSFLDLRHTVILLDLVRDLCREEGVALGIVLHDLNLAAMYCDRLLLLSEGKCHAEGAPGDVLRYDDLCEVYGTELYVAPNDVTGQTVVLPLAREHRGRLGRGEKS